MGCVTSKMCSSCGVEKSIEEFWRSLGGYEASCKQCRMVKRYEQRLQKRKELGLNLRVLTNRQVKEFREHGLRYCPSCKRVLVLSEFSHCSGGKNNAPHCRECNQGFQALRNQTEEAKHKHVERYQKNKERLRNQNLVRKYGISLEKYRDMLLNQKGLCIICGKTQEENGKDLAVDHDHKTGKVRGLLCNNCNVAVGFLKDNPDIAIKINEYLKKG